jgi:hypothetical protein
MTASRYSELLSERDLTVLGRVSGHRATEDAAAWFRNEPARIVAALDTRASFDSMFDTAPEPTLETVSPLLVFAVLVHRAANEIGEHAHIPERFGTRLLVPVFDGERLALFAAAPATRLLLVELLGSYTRVSSGPQWERSRGRWQRRRFSEMNPAQMARLAASLPFDERAGVYRRLGDLALFSNGVFPDHAARQKVSPIDLERILRSVPDGARIDLGRLLGTGPVDSEGPLLAALGPHWYRLASKLVPIPSMSAQLADLADHFDQARRFLNFVTDRYLWNRRDWLFPGT